MYQLCYKKSIIPTVQVDYVPCDIPLDVDEVMKANGILLRCRKVFNQIKYVEDAFEDFIAFKSTVTVPAIVSDMTLERKARSFFLEFAIFLDHWNKYMSWRGKKEEFKTVFEDATHNAFDSSDDYALASMLRNYIAHNADVIQGKFWGGNTYDVGCSKDVLLADDGFSKTKKEIIKRQPAKFISLTPIMKGALEKLGEIHQKFISFDFGDEEIAAARIVKDAITAIKTSNMQDKHLCFVNDIKSLITTYTAENQPIETVWATEYHDFVWKDYTAVLAYLLPESRRR
jgi:hypothetical protein